MSTELQSVVLKALDKNPERRYQSVRELCVDLVRTLPDAESTRSVPRTFASCIAARSDFGMPTL